MASNITVSLPVTNDEQLLSFGEHSQCIRRHAVALGLRVLEQGRVRPLNKTDWVAFLILQRMNECLLSFEFLIVLERERDAAVLLVTLLELSFDLRFVQRHPEEAEAWLAHNNRRKKPWQVARLLNDLFKNPSEHEAMAAVYEHCSMIKHGNPSGGTITLPLGVDNRWIVRQKRPARDMLLAYTYVAAGVIHEALIAAGKVWSNHGFDLGNEGTGAAESWKAMSKLEEMHIIEILEGLKEDANAPS